MPFSNFALQAANPATKKIQQRQYSGICVDFDAPPSIICMEQGFERESTSHPKRVIYFIVYACSLLHPGPTPHRMAPDR
jgi:hypothetical protein